MTSGGSRTINRWTDPSTLVGVLGLLMVGMSGYRDFQDGTDREISDLKVRVAVLETGAAQRERRLDLIERGK